ncbi:MAG: hypothetical protein K0R38_5904, partial [Polyangiaceae bacterium]|nr:hypothetical protein [Polyangiaceae bacterium]
GQGNYGRGNYGQGSSGQGNYGRGNYGQGSSGQGSSGQGRAGQGNYGQGSSGQGNYGRGSAGQGNYGQREESRPGWYSRGHTGTYGAGGGGYHGGHSGGGYGGSSGTDYGSGSHGGYAGGEVGYGGNQGASYGTGSGASRAAFGSGTDQGYRARDFGSPNRDLSGTSPRGGFAGRGPKGYTRTDERIREEVCDRLSMDDDVDATDIEVRVQDGEVTLEGSVETRRMKHQAEDAAEAVNGVKDVHNKLRVMKGFLNEMKDKVTGKAEEGHYANTGTKNAPSTSSTGTATNGRV